MTKTRKQTEANRRMEYLTCHMEQELRLQEFYYLETTINTCTEPTRAFLERLQGKLDDVYNQLFQGHVKLIALKPTVATAVSPDLYNPKQFLDVQAKYFNLVEHIFTLMPANNLSRHSSVNFISNEAHTLSHVKFPAISIPKFNGDCDKWINFRNLFLSLIGSKATLSDEEKIHYLQSSLTGEAAVLVSVPSFGEARFEDVWKNLKDRYDNKLDLVNSALKQLFGFEFSAQDLGSNLKKLREIITSSTNTLKALDRPVDTWDDMLIFLVAGKLDKVSREQWDTKVGEKSDLPTFAELMSFLDSRIRICTNKKISESKPANASKVTVHSHQTASSQQSSDSSLKEKSSNQKESQSKKPPAQNFQKTFCYFCKNSLHSITHCEAFRALLHSDKNKFVQNYNLCPNCLGKHDLAKCQSSKRCLTCGGRHHTQLHAEPDSSPGGLNVHLSSGSSSTMMMLATARVLVRAPSGRTTVARAILDPCSECSIVSEPLVQGLKLGRMRTSATITGINGSTTARAISAVQVKLYPVTSNDVSVSVRALVLPKVTTYRAPAISLSELPQEWQSLQLADDFLSTDGRIDLLLGADVLGHLLEEGFLRSESSSLFAQKSIFGWVISGPVSKLQFSQQALNVHHGSLDPTSVFDLTKFWELEEVPKVSPPSKEEQECEDHFVTTHKRLPDGRFEVSLPFLTNPPELGSSRLIAEKQLLRTEQRMNKNTELAQQYRAFMTEYDNLGHMSCIGPVTSHYSGQNLLTHFPILREESQTTKFRIVFNGSASTANSISLNDCLHVGPCLLNDLPAILCRWRFHKFVLKCDVAKMFRQIRVNPTDRKWQCILWRHFSNEPIQLYELNTVTYGIRASPFLANRVVRQLSLEASSDFPEASKVLEKEDYVDDVFLGGGGGGGES